MRLLRRVLLLVLLLLLAGLAVVLYYVANPNLPIYQAPSRLHYLDQWSDQARQTYYYTPQGTTVKGLRYEWFTALELPFSRDRFARPEYLARFGFLVDPKQTATAQNPGNLPVGMARLYAEQEAAKEALGLSGPVVISVGALIARKGQDLLIRALADLPGAPVQFLPKPFAIKDLLARIDTLAG